MVALKHCENVMVLFFIACAVIPYEDWQRKSLKNKSQGREDIGKLNITHEADWISIY